MSLRRFFAPSVLATSFVLAAATVTGCSSASTDDGGESGSAAATQGRPPQFVLLEFDGSYNNEFWAESRAFAKANPVKFTYFINSVYYVARPNNASYTAPGKRAGASAIGWGDNSQDVAARLEQTRLAHAEGNEIGSHTAGHWDGSAWSEDQWTDEFDAFEQMFWGSARTAGLPAVNMGFTQYDIKGFRAPQLGHSPGLFKTLAKKGFTYDTSKSGAPNRWPDKQNGVWNFALAQLRIVGSGKSTLSMDYNFFVADSKGVNDPDSSHHAVFEKQAVDTYMQYFQSNYFGNRAPIHIGHHFSKWNGGAYWNAMQTVAKRVCSLPEVQCVTDSDLVKYVEENSDKLADFQAGSFPKMARPPSSANDNSAVQPIDPSELPPAEAHGAHDDAPQGE